MKLKDLIGISLVSLFLFPVVLIGIMLAAGVVHLETGDGKDKERLKETFTASEALRQTGAEEKHLKAFKAAELKEKEVAAKEAELGKEMERLEALRLETNKALEEIARERKRIEDLVDRNSESQDKQIAALAEVYGGMRPEEAAPILLSLDDAMVVRILRKIPESRATSKLMAALAALDVRRAARLTALLGGKGQVRNRPAAEPSRGKQSEENKPESKPETKPETKTEAKPEAGNAKDAQAGA
jgi:flagellar motility protein MotE (MotC chaperone)